MNRRRFLCGSAGVAMATEISRTTYVYKKVRCLKIKADVHRVVDDPVRPVVIWIHGGALIMGNREGIAAPVKKWAADKGYVLVSIDYRLAPETQLPEIIRDVEDAFSWIRQDGPRLFRADPDKIVVAGGSAGGYLTLTAGFRVKPRPRVLLSLWGYGDLIGDWYSTPSPHARHQAIKMTREEAYRQVEGCCHLRRSRPPRRWQRFLSALPAIRYVAPSGAGLGSKAHAGEILPVHACEECLQRLSSHRDDPWNGGHGRSS